MHVNEVVACIHCNNVTLYLFGCVKINTKCVHLQLCTLHSTMLNLHLTSSDGAEHIFAHFRRTVSTNALQFHGISGTNSDRSRRMHD